MSARIRAGAVRATLAAWLVAVAGCSAPASEAPARNPLAELDALPNVEVVQADDVELEVVITAPEAGSARARALAALADADGLVLYSLQPWAPPPPPGPRPDSRADPAAAKAYDQAASQAFEKSQREWCVRGGCLHSNKVLGHVEVVDAASRLAVATALRESLGKVPDYATACIEEFRHAVQYRAGGHEYLVLLCYQCGQVGIAIDGELVDIDQTYEMGEEAALDAILAKAGIALAPKGA